MSSRKSENKNRALQTPHEITEIIPSRCLHLLALQSKFFSMKILTRAVPIIALITLSSCASGITAAQKRESSSYKAKGLYVEEKKVGLATWLGLLPGGGSFYTREYAIGVLNLLVWPASVLWDPISGSRAAETINYYATRERVESVKKEEIRELNNMLIADKISNKAYIIKKEEIEDRYSPSH